MFLSSKCITDVSTSLQLCLVTVLVHESSTASPLIFQTCHILSFLRACAYTVSSPSLFFLYFAWWPPFSPPCPCLEVMPSRTLTSLSIRVSYQFHLYHSSDLILSHTLISYIYMPILYSKNIILNFSFHKGKIYTALSVYVMLRSTGIFQIITNGWMNR